MNLLLSLDTRIEKNQLLTGFLLLAIGIVPHTTLGIFYPESLSLGLLIAAMLVMLTRLNLLQNIIHIPVEFVVLFALFIGHFIATQLIFATGNIKSYSSMLAFIFLSLASFFLGEQIYLTRAINLNKAIKFVAFFLVLLAIINRLFDLKFANFIHHNAVVPFGEASHFATFAGPFLLAAFLLTCSITKKIAYIVVAVATAAVLPSMTMAVFPIIMMATFITPSVRSLLALVVVFPVFFISFYQNDYFLSRLMISEDSSNISALVYLQGIYDAGNGLIHNTGLGLGFQKLGTQEASSIALLIEKLMGSSDVQLNREDGGFLAAKIVAEFGVVGVIIIFVYLIAFYRRLMMLKNIKNSHDHIENTHLLFSIAIFLGFSVELFVRGFGYFSPMVVLFIAVNFYQLKYLRLIKRHALHLRAIV